ncbi:MAG: hypothetical protein SFY92_07930 [Verrucomicrobiae bacterium]|nr:hypothetical protein [Verrucomicrobiae bacterium]
MKNIILKSGAIILSLSILALITLVIAPRFLRSRVRSKTTTLVNDVRMINSAAELYAIDNGLTNGTGPTFVSPISESRFRPDGHIASPSQNTQPSTNKSRTP